MTIRRIGPQNGTLKVNTYREGVAQKLGHDLVLEVGQWNATLEVGPDGAIQSVELNADPSSLQLAGAHNGAKALTDRDRSEIHRSIDAKVLRGKPIAFASTAIEPRAGGVTVVGDLTMADMTRATSFEMQVSGSGRATGTMPVTQSEWGMEPFKALMGALKVRDTVEVVVDVRLASA
ncbi:MAG: YceI family protein [Actinomycetota bacterium]|nr:YceI family protein [Actinomycetota bacterium]